jgi:small-conductance mechanosensitive channel
MKIKTSDPLLASAKVLIVLSQIVIVFAMVMLGIGIGALVTVGYAELANKVAETGAPAYTFWLIVLAMLTGMAILALAFKFLRELTGIIDSVDQGDPFHPLNARRLSRMGWISVIGHLLILPVMGLAVWAAPFMEEAGNDSHISGGIDFGMILLTLILFILARVFKRGAEMREELEGTV